MLNPLTSPDMLNPTTKRHMPMFLDREILLPDMPSDPSLLAGMQNLTICWWTLWFLTNLLVDTGPNKIFISGLSRREKHGKCPFCPWLFLLPWSPSSGRDAVLVSEPRQPLFLAGGGFPAAVAHTCPRRGGAAARARRRGRGRAATRVHPRGHGGAAGGGSAATGTGGSR